MLNPQMACPPAPPRWLPWTWLGLLWAAIFALAVSGYPNLVDNERRVGGYIMDVVQNGHWAIQRDVTGDIASKPPMLTWIASLSALSFGRINRFSIYLPSALATLGVTWLLFAVGRKHFGWRAGFISALAYLLSYVADKQVVTARYDGVFAFPVMLGAMAAYRAWTTGGGWTGFWLANALATLVKGPLGLILSGSGLLAAFWERRSGHRVPLRGSHWLGILLYLAICGGWFAMAYHNLGQGVIDKMLGRELVRHAVADGDHRMGQGFWEPVWNTFTNFFPWSIAAGIALWGVIKRPATDIEERRFERFICCWIVVSMILFSVASHQRGRLAWPLVPALALLAGREIDRHWKAMTSQKLFRIAGALTAFVLVFFVIYHHVLQSRSLSVQRTLGMKYLAGEIRTHVGENYPITYVDAPFAVQFYLSTLRRNASFQQAAAVLASDAPAFVLVQNYDRLIETAGTNLVLHQLLVWTQKEEKSARSSSNRETVRLVSNRERLEPFDHVEACLERTRLRLDGAALVSAKANDFTVAAKTSGASITLQNTVSNTLPVTVRWATDRNTVLHHELVAGEIWRVTAP